MNPTSRSRFFSLTLAAAAALGTATWAYADSCCASHAATETQMVAQAEAAGHEGHAHEGQPAAGDTKEAGRVEKTETTQVTLSGTNYCVSCSVTTKSSAMAECERNGHKMAVKVKQAKDSNGNEISELKGKVLRYTANEKAGALTDRALWGEQVTLEGTISKSGRQLTISKIAKNENPALPTSTPEDAARYVSSLSEGDQYFTCTMCPEVVSNKPGDCPKCGMKLVEQAKGPSENDAAEKPAGGHDHADHQH